MVEIEANEFDLSKHEDKTSYLNKILRGEISAVESYQQVLETVEDKKEDQDKIYQLSKIKEDHEHHVEKLRSLVENTHDVPDDESGPWGNVVATIVGTAKIGGSGALVKTLIEGEEHGLKEYKEALNYELTPEEKAAIENELIPSIESHISTLRSVANF